MAEQIAVSGLKEAALCIVGLGFFLFSGVCAYGRLKSLCLFNDLPTQEHAGLLPIAYFIYSLMLGC